MDIDEIIETIKNNLSKNGFPEKRVSFAKEKINNFIKKHDFDPEDVLGEMELQDIGHEIKDDKIVFHKKLVESAGQGDFDPKNLNMDAFKNMDPNVLREQAEQFMKTMSPEQMEEIKRKVDQMSPEEKEKLMKMAQQMNFKS